MTRPRFRNWGTDGGAATVWVLGLAAVVVAVALAVVVRASAVLARHRLERTADLAALAAADQIGRAGPPCAAAARIATANGAALGACILQGDASARGGTVTITVRSTARFAFLGKRMLTAHARAGRTSIRPVPSSSDVSRAGRNTVGRDAGAGRARLWNGAGLSAELVSGSAESVTDPGWPWSGRSDGLHERRVPAAGRASAGAAPRPPPLDHFSDSSEAIGERVGDAAESGQRR